MGALLLGLLALQVVGVVLVVGLLITPGATASLLTDRSGRMLVIAPTLSAACSIVGILLSYWLDASPGGLVVALQGLVFGIVLLLSPRRGLLVRGARRGVGRARSASA